MAGALVTGTSAASADPGGVVISELNYHAGSDLDTDDFLELTNTGGSAIDMSGWAFTAGVTATLPSGAVIPAGGYYVVARDSAQFQLTNGFAPDAVYTGNLSNSGETVTLMNGATVVDTVTYADTDPWPPSPDGNGPSLELRNLMADNTQPEFWGASTVTGGTPRAVNSINGTPPQLRAAQVTATPQSPAPNEAIVVSAKLPSGSTATLSYKVMFGADVTIPFLDDAASPGGAGDSVFAATIPGQAAGRLVRYRIDADRAGNTYSYPTGDDTINYAGVVVQDPSVVTNLPVINWFMDPAVYDDILANHRYDNVTGPAVIAYGNQVVDNAAMRVRGQSSRDDPKVNWKVELPSGHFLDMRPNMPYPLDEFAIQSDVDPRAIIAWDTVGNAGARRLGIFSIRTQLNGQFWSVGMAMETMDGSWRKDQKVDNWAIYKGNYGALATKATPTALENSMWAGCPLCEPEQWLEKKARETEDYTDVWQLTQALDTAANATQRAWLRQNVNIPEVVNYMAINVIMRHQDSNNKNWWISRDTEGTGRWEMWHWDLNRTWINTTAEKGEFINPAVANRLLKAMMSDPQISQMVYRRVRSLADQFLTPGGYEAKWDALTGQYLSDWQLEIAKWGGQSPSAMRTRFVACVQDRRTVIANNTGPGKLVPTSQSASPDVVINEIQYQPAGGTNAEFIELTNPSSTESVDLSGWTIDGIGLTIQPGTVLLPNAQVVFVKNDVTFRATYGSSTRFVGGQYPGDLSDAGETIRLLQGARVVDSVTYSPTAPWPTAAAGTGPSLELGAPGLDNSLPESWSATSTTGGTPSAPNTAVLPPDTEDPSAPGTPVASNITQTGVTLTWAAATDNRGVAGYRVVRDGVVLPGTVGGTTFTDSDLTPGATYSYRVRAVDTSGNVGPDSAAVQVTILTSGSALFSDDFTGVTGTGWKAAWLVTQRNGSATIQSDAGQLLVNNVSGSYVRAHLSGVPTVADADLLFSYRWNSGNPAAYFNVFIRGSGGWKTKYRPTNGYGLQFTANSTTVGLKKMVNGTLTNLRGTAGAQQVGTAKQWVRLQVVGSTVRYKTWVDGQAEPSAWRVSLTDTSVTAPGQVFVSLVRSSGATEAKSVTVDDLVLTGL